MRSQHAAANLTIDTTQVHPRGAALTIARKLGLKMRS
jgi:hypothetical protein